MKTKKSPCLTPYRIWQKLKTKYPDVILMFEVDGVYHVYGDDRHVVGQLLDFVIGSEPDDPCIIRIPIFEYTVSLLVRNGYQVGVAQVLK